MIGIEIIVITVIVACSIIGFLIGMFMAKFTSGRRDKKLKRDLEEIILGNKENAIEIDGVKYHANKFRLRDEKGNEIVVDLKGGIVEDATEEEKVEDDSWKDCPDIEPYSRSPGKEKRTSRTRNARIRRYG